MAWLSPSVTRALVVSAIALVGSLIFYSQYQTSKEEDQARALKFEKERFFNALCFDALTVDQVLIEDSKQKTQLRLEDRWRRANNGVIEDQKLKVALAELRGLRVERLDNPGQLASLGLDIPEQTLTVKSSIHKDSCRVSLGAKHPTKPFVVIQRRYQKQESIGWAKLRNSTGALIDLNQLKATTILPLSVGQIDSLAVAPQVGLSAYEIRRRHGYFLLVTPDQEERADRQTVDQVLTQLVGLKGELKTSATALSDPDLVLTIGHSPLKTRLAFYRQSERLLVAGKDLVFEAKNSDLSWLMRAASSWRDLQMTHYERGQTRSVEIHDGSGRVFKYRRIIDENGGLDRWFNGDKAIDQAHRLSGLQWDLHRLRGMEIIDELDKLECLSGCARVRVFDAQQTVLVDVLIDRRGKDAFVQRRGGPVLRIEAKAVEHWPFDQLN
ncbi:MAG: hypothetical protein CL512_04790 [Actinobacteria bacterium]|nr:hypothetical protein [Actinomycetota bacterium]